MPDDLMAALTYSIQSNRVLTFLARQARRDECPPTAGEIADHLGWSAAEVSTVLDRLEAEGEVVKLGVAFYGINTDQH